MKLWLLLIWLIPSSAFAAELEIGLVYSKSQWKKYQQGVDELQNYTQVIKNNGHRIVPFYVGEDASDINMSLSRIQGLLIPGGDDVNPARYHERPRKELEDWDDSLDQLELRLLRQAEKRRIPVLGICRGLQIINVHRKGTLYQDIPAQLGTKIAHRIMRAGKSQPAYHEVTLSGRLEKLLHISRLRVNTYHHQGVKTLGEGLRILAAAEDGLVEAFESTDRAPILAVQFHPEKDPEMPEMKLILNEYFAATQTPPSK